MTEAQQKIAAFLVDLTELTRKHGIYIHGCGCCGSPSLNGEPKPGAYFTDGNDNQLSWIEDHERERDIYFLAGGVGKTVFCSEGFVKATFDPFERKEVTL